MRDDGLAGFPSAEAFLEAMASDSSGFVTYVDRERRVRFVNRGCCEWFGLPREQIIGRKESELFSPEAHAQFAVQMDRAFAGERVRYERMARRQDGTSHWISVALDPHRDASGEVVGIFSCALEVNELKRTHDALGRALAELDSHIENSPLAVVEWSAQSEVRRWSRQAEAIFAWSAEEAVGRRASSLGLVHAESLPAVSALLAELKEGRAKHNRILARNLTRDGRAIFCEWYNSAFFDEQGRLSSILSLIQDVTARVEAEEQLQRAAVMDSLTGLPNRNSLAARLEHAIMRVNRSGDRIALLFIDLDRFKRVNDTLGHSAGDEILRQAAARIRNCVREVDSVARVGGDEFVVLLETDVHPDTPSVISERIRAAFEAGFSWRSTPVSCGASVGISLYPDHARDPAALLASADEAMYRAKQGA